MPYITDQGRVGPWPARTENRKVRKSRELQMKLFLSLPWEAGNETGTLGVMEELEGAQVERPLGLSSHKLSVLNVPSRAGGCTQSGAS